MNENTLRIAMVEADRFLRVAKVALREFTSQDHYCGGKETAAAKRASMDLTRALANIRRPG